MGRRKWGGTVVTFLKENLLSGLVFVAVVGSLLYGLETTKESSAQERLRILDESITRAIVSCYAIEGLYPESLAYLEQYYGLHIDESNYYVEYSIFASNVMPVVTIIEVGT